MVSPNESRAPEISMDYDAEQEILIGFMKRCNLAYYEGDSKGLLNRKKEVKI